MHFDTHRSHITTTRYIPHAAYSWRLHVSLAAFHCSARTRPCSSVCTQKSSLCHTEVQTDQAACSRLILWSLRYWFHRNAMKGSQSWGMKSGTPCARPTAYLILFLAENEDWASRCAIRCHHHEPAEDDDLIFRRKYWVCAWNVVTYPFPFSAITVSISRLVSS